MNFHVLSAAADTAADGAGGNNYLVMLLVYAALFGGVYFLLIRPNSKKKKEEAELRKNLAIGDDITTIGGIVGRVVAIKDDADELVIETGADRVKLKMKRWCISSVNHQKEIPAKSTASAEEPAKKKRRFF